MGVGVWWEDRHRKGAGEEGGRHSCVRVWGGGGGRHSCVRVWGAASDTSHWPYLRPVAESKVSLVGAYFQTRRTKNKARKP